MLNHQFCRLGVGILESDDKGQFGHLATIQASAVLYQHLDAMRAAMNPIPPHIYFSFNFLNGYLYQPSQFEDVSPILWHAHNPNYDPGPLPEKKEKERKGKDKESAGENANPTNREECGTNAPSSSTTQSTNPRGNGRGKKRSYPPVALCYGDHCRSHGMLWSLPTTPR